MNYRTQKQNLLNRIEKLLEYSKTDENIYSHLLSLKNEIQNELQFNVLCTGEFSAGKSTFINKFFIGKDVLPTKATETTAKLTFVKYGEEEKIVIHYLNNSKETINEVNEGTLEKYLSKGGEKIKEVDFVEVFIKSEVLKEGVTIVDSPGLNAPENERVNLTNKFIPKADAVLYLMSALQAWKGSEKEFLENKILNKEDIDKIFFLVNYWDVLEEGEGEDVINYIKTEMLKSLEIVKRDLGEVSTPPIIPISAKTGYNFDKLEEELISYLSSKKGINILNQKVEKFESIKRKILKLLEEKKELSKKNKEKLKEELENIQKELSNLKNQLKEYKKELYKKVEVIVNKWFSNVEDLYREFGRNVVEKLHKKDLKPKEIEPTIKKIIINQSNYLQKKLDLINKKLLKALEDLSEEEKANFNIEKYFIKKEVTNTYELEKKFRSEIKSDRLYENIPEISTAIGIGTAALFSALSISPASLLILSLSPIAGGLFLYFRKQNEIEIKNKLKAEEAVEDLINEIISNLEIKKEEIIESIVDNIKNEIIQTYEAKEREYKTILKKMTSNETNEEINKLIKVIEKI